MEDLTPFDDFNKFFAWYINIIKSKVDGYNVAMSSDEIHVKMGLLTKEQREFTERKIRQIQKIPPKISFVNDNRVGTFASRWNGAKNKAEIIYPSVTYYWLRFPQIIKTVIQHEIGHIINLDILFKSEYGKDYDRAHSSCINMSMDCRINQNLNYETLDYINRCLFTFSNSQTELIVPETFAVKQCGLPITLKGKLTWTLIHNNYHIHHPEPLIKDEEQFINLGMYVKTLVEKDGEPKETYARVIERDNENYTLVRITDEEKQALINDDYKFFENFNDYISVIGENCAACVSMIEIVDQDYIDKNTINPKYEFSKNKIEITPIPKPVRQKPELPQEGDIALAIRNINSINEANFAMIIEVISVSENKYKIIEFNDEVQKVIGRGDAKTYFEMLESGENIWNDNQEEAIYLEDFILKNLQPPSTEPPKPQKTNQIKEPKVGDVIVITKGDNRGKYGIIKKITEEGKFEIEEISEKVAKSMVSKKE